MPTITSTHLGRALAVITLAGEVDLAALDRLRAALARARGCAHVVIDAAGVDFIDCCALTPLLAAARAARAGGASLRLRDPSAATTALISWTHLEDQLPTTGAPHRRASAGAAVVAGQIRPDAA